MGQFITEFRNFYKSILEDEMDTPAKNLPMVSGFPDRAPYKKVVGKKRNWFYQPGPFAADTVYMDGYKGSQGFGGSEVKFNLTDGSEHIAIGPWKSSAHSMLKDTGLDITNQYATMLSLSKDVEYDKVKYYERPKMIDLVHHEETWVEGTFDRPMKLAQEIANKLGQKLFYFITTSGGAQSAWIKPQGESNAKVI